MIAEVDIPDDTKVFDLASYASSSFLYLEPPWFSDFATWMVERTRGKLRDITDPQDISWFKRAMEYHSERLQMEFILCAFAAESGYGAKILTVDDNEVMQIFDTSLARIVSISEVGLKDRYPEVAEHSQIVRAKTGRQRLMELDELMELQRDIPDSVLADYSLSTPYTLGDDEAMRQVRLKMTDLACTLQTILRLNTDLRNLNRSFMQDIELDYLTLAAIKRAYSLMGELLVAIRVKRGNEYLTLGERLELPGAALKDLVRPEGYEGWPDRLLEIALDRSVRPKIIKRQEVTFELLQKEIAKLHQMIKTLPMDRTVLNAVLGINVLVQAMIDRFGTSRFIRLAGAIPNVLDA
jgi:hypothetical protein